MNKTEVSESIAKAIDLIRSNLEGFRTSINVLNGACDRAEQSLARMAPLLRKLTKARSKKVRGKKRLTRMVDRNGEG